MSGFLAKHALIWSTSCAIWVYSVLDVYCILWCLHPERIQYCRLMHHCLNNSYHPMIRSLHQIELWHICPKFGALFHFCISDLRSLLSFMGAVFAALNNLQSHSYWILGKVNGRIIKVKSYGLLHIAFGPNREQVSLRAAQIVIHDQGGRKLWRPIICHKIRKSTIITSAIISKPSGHSFLGCFPKWQSAECVLPETCELWCKPSRDESPFEYKQGKHSKLFHANDKCLRNHPWKQVNKRTVLASLCIHRLSSIVNSERT